MDRVDSVRHRWQIAAQRGSPASLPPRYHGRASRAL